MTSFPRAFARARRAVRASRRGAPLLVRSLTLLIIVSTTLIAFATTSVRARTLDDIADTNGEHTRASDASSREDTSTRASRLQAQWDLQRAFTKAMRHASNDLPSDGACKDVILRMCGSVTEARTLLDRAWRYVVQEEHRGGQGPLRASFGDGRRLLYSSSASRRNGPSSNRRSGNAHRSSSRDNYNANKEKEKEAASAAEKEAEAAERTEREKRAKEAAFERLKSFPAGTLANDPHKLEARIKYLESQVEANADSTKLPTLQRQLEAAKNEKEKMISGAFASEGKSAGSFNDHADDHWFLEDGEGSKHGYRHRGGRAAPELTARQRYDYLSTKVPEFSKSYFDCVGHVIKMENDQKMQQFMMSGGSLKDHKTIVSNECKVELKTLMRDRYDAFKAEGSLLNECVDDIKIKCPYLENGFGLITTCLLKEKTRSKSSFTPSCEQALSTVKTTPHAETHPTDELTKHVEVEKNAEHAQTVETQPMLTHEEQHLVNSVKEESQAEKDARNEKIAKKFSDDNPTPAKDSVVTKKEDKSRPKAEQEPVVVKDPTLAKSTENLEAKLREANARIKLAEEAAAHASAQTRNFVLLLMFCATSFGITRKGSRRRIVFMFKKLRLSQKGAQL